MTEDIRSDESNTTGPNIPGDASRGITGSGNGQRKWYARKRVIIPLFILIIAALLAVAYWYIYLRGYVSTDDAFIDGDRITISAKILGRITHLGADEGDTVAAGQLLVGLDNTDLKAQEAQVEANLKYAEQNRDLAAINLKKAREDFERSSTQFNDGVITREKYDHDKIAQEAARAELDLALAQIGNIKAQLNVVQTQLKNTEITASLPGVVAKRWVVEGDVIQPGQPVFTVYDLDSLWVSAIFEETKLRSIHQGSPVEIHVDAYPGRKFEGRVEMIGAATASQFSLIPPNNASGNFTKVTQRVPIKISIKSGEKERQLDPVSLIPGMSVVVKIDVKE